MSNKIEKLFSMINKMDMKKDFPKGVVKYARENNLIIILGARDDLMCCYGTESYMTEYQEHDYGYDGETFNDIDDKLLEAEVKQLGLEILWCGENEDRKIEGYDADKKGAFSYIVDDKIKHMDFIVMGVDEVYCTGIIIELPSDFKVSRV